MKCEACGSSWNAAEELVGKITKCPFCGRELYEKTIEGQMKLLVKQHGIGILSDAAKINGILADMFPQNSRERAAVKTALGIGAGRMFFDIAQSHEPEEKRLEKLKLIRKRLIDEAWMSDAAADYICRVFLSAAECEELLQIALSSREPLREKEAALVHGADFFETASEPDTLSAQETSIETEISRILTAAMNGDSDAQYHMGCLYYTGTEVGRDFNKAYKMFLQAAEQGNPNAQNSLGVLYEDSMDVTNAMKWYKKAADNGNANASASYLRLRNRYPIAIEDE